MSDPIYIYNDGNVTHVVGDPTDVPAGVDVVEATDLAEVDITTIVSSGGIVVVHEDVG